MPGGSSWPLGSTRKLFLILREKSTGPTEVRHLKGETLTNVVFVELLLILTCKCESEAVIIVPNKLETEQSESD
jgi:hypothetical protein